MKLRNPLPKVLGLFLFAIAIQVSLNSQTRWSVIQKLSNVDDDVSRVTYENGGFNFVWQETDYWSPWDEGGPVYVQRFGDNPSPSLPFRLRIVDSEMGGWPNSTSGKELYIHYATNEGEFVATIQEGDYLNIPDDLVFIFHDSFKDLFSFVLEVTINTFISVQIENHKEDNH